MSITKKRLVQATIYNEHDGSEVTFTQSLKDLDVIEVQLTNKHGEMMAIHVTKDDLYEAVLHFKS